LSAGQKPYAIDTGHNRAPRLSVSLIGSFRKFYDQVAEAAEVFTSAGIVVRSPTISTVINREDSYVRFAADPPLCSDSQIQAATNEKIRASDLVYVVAPGGYVGRATCLELGMIYDRGIPVFYSAAPEDIPLDVSPDSVISATALAARLRLAGATPGLATCGATDGWPEGRLMSGAGMVGWVTTAW
jgi:hypothetical protein